MIQPADSNINNSFFSGIYKEVWKKLIPPGLSEAEVDFILETGNIQKGGRMLDLMCGYGRHTLEAARRGISVTAVDNSEEYIQEIRKRSAIEQLPVETICNSVVDLEVKGEFDLAICMGNSFAFFNKEESLNVLYKISNVLKPGGKWIINTWMIAEIAIRYFKEKDWFYVDGYKYLTDNVFYINPSRIETDHIIISENGTTERIKGVDYIFTVSELQQMFAETGLSFSEIYSTPRKKKFRLGDNRAYIVAEKI